MKRAIGFSTGSIAPGDVPRALEILRESGTSAIELSALRIHELRPLVERADDLDLLPYAHVSVHAPSKIDPPDEPAVVGLLNQLCQRGWGVVVHPDAMHDLTLWQSLGGCVWVETMDRRKPIGRTAEELESVFQALPRAGLCFDIAHARQCDPTMLEAYRILRAHGDRIRQVHVSEVGTASKHARLSFGAIVDFQEVAQWIPGDTPAIIESPVSVEQIADEVEKARSALASPVRAVA